MLGSGTAFGAIIEKAFERSDVRRRLEELIRAEREAHLRAGRVRQDKDDNRITVLVGAPAAHAVEEFNPEFRRRKIEDDADEGRKTKV